jgi:1-acyl-sn-glycerol-3-phosphate acyltransferase
VIVLVSRFWRLIATAASFVLFGVAALALSAGLIILSLAPIKQSLKRHYSRYSIMLISRLYVYCYRVLGVLNVKFENMHLLNQPGALIIANHPTLLDAILLLSVMPRTNLIVKAAVANNPFLSIIVSMAGYIPNNELGIALVKKASAALKSGETLMIFPEGTRTDLEQGLNFKRSAAIIALQANCTISPVLISCEPITLRKHEPWYAIPKTIPLFHVRALPPLQISDCIDTTHPRSIQARELNQFLQQQFAQHLNQKIAPNLETPSLKTPSLKTKE